MGLNYDTSGCKKLDLKEHGQLVYPMCMLCINTGIGSITEKNYKLFWRRVNFLEKIYGSFYTAADGTEGVTLEMVELFIGLKTNASFKDETKTSFLKRHLDHMAL